MAAASWARPLPQIGEHHQGGDDIGGGEERRELRARDQLDVAQRRAFRFRLARREARRFPAGKASRNQTLVPIRSFVHPPAVPRVRAAYPKRVEAELRPARFARNQRILAAVVKRFLRTSRSCARNARPAPLYPGAMATDSATLDRRAATPRRAADAPKIHSPAEPIARGMGLDRPVLRRQEPRLLDPAVDRLERLFLPALAVRLRQFDGLDVAGPHACC